MQKSAAPMPTYGAAPVNIAPSGQPLYYQPDAVVFVGGQPGVQQQVPYATQTVVYNTSAGNQQQYPLHRMWLMVYSFGIGAIGAWLYFWAIYSSNNFDVTLWLGAIGGGYTAVFGLIAAASKNRAMIALTLLGLFALFVYTLVAVVSLWINNGYFRSGYWVAFGFALVTAFTFCVSCNLYKRVTSDLRSRQEFEQGLIQGQPVSGSGYQQVV